ncbi:MAG TPA: BTAD domain-containing putative transcriptional regulator, partial [Actinomycetota bacterium]|nr:BTAD domain-containing putative transcriptional regulator [Actinomycetota bacterium]
MRFGILGPVEVSGGNGPAPLGGPKQRTVLAHLILNPGQVVPADQLIDALWGEEPPENARGILQTYVSRLRSIVGTDVLERRPPGYVLLADPEEVDAVLFERLLREARRGAVDPKDAVPRLTEALDLWRGPALADLADEPSFSAEIARLEELRLQATQERIAAELELGHYAQAVAELESLTRVHPLRERLWEELMLALYRLGRPADALAAYERARGILADELGVDPSRDLRALHERILREDPELEPAGEPLRGYRLLEQVGEGAFGVVYRALQPQVGREVAIKAMPPELANHPDFVRRFEHEAQIVARLEHPHIVPLYDFWREPDAAYLVMRFLRGGSLEDLLGDGPLEPERAAGILDHVASALAAAHRQGVVHRDVKPGNILLDEEGNAYLTDFGVALDAGSPERTTGTMIRGTPAYLSPEQIRLDPASPRSDVYALGIVLFEMLTGLHPFPDSSLTMLLDHHLRDPLPSALDMRPDLPARADEVIARATAKEADRRFT